MGSVSESGIVAAASSKASSMLLTMKDRGPKEEVKELLFIQGLREGESVGIM